jgi:hypothetical protein
MARRAKMKAIQRMPVAIAMPLTAGAAAARALGKSGVKKVLTSP